MTSLWKMVCYDFCIALSVNICIYHQPLFWNVLGEVFPANFSKFLNKIFFYVYVCGLETRLLVV